ncbi:hypothetical protein GCM10023148_28550 [Actinokineospora soli]
MTVEHARFDTPAPPPASHFPLTSPDNSTRGKARLQTGPKPTNTDGLTTRDDHRTSPAISIPSTKDHPSTCLRDE